MKKVTFVMILPDAAAEWAMRGDPLLVFNFSNEEVISKECVDTDPPYGIIVNGGEPQMCDTIREMEERAANVLRSGGTVKYVMPEHMLGSGVSGAR